MNLSKTRVLIALTGLAALFSIATVNGICTSASAGTQASDDARRITPDEVRDLLKQNKAVLVDVRPEASYKQGHIRGARSIPYSEIGERAKELPRDKMIVAYCS